MRAPRARRGHIHRVARVAHSMWPRHAVLYWLSSPCHPRKGSIPHPQSLDARPARALSQPVPNVARGTANSVHPFRPWSTAPARVVCDTELCPGAPARALPRPLHRA